MVSTCVGVRYRLLESFVLVHDKILLVGQARPHRWQPLCVRFWYPLADRWCGRHQSGMEVVFSWVVAFANNDPLLFALLFLLAFINVFFPPIPIETIGVFVGYLSGVGHGDPLVMWLALSAGVAVGSTLLFLLAYSKGGNLLKIGFVKRQVTPTRLQRAKVWFRRYGVWTIFASKLVPGMSLVTIIAGGLVGMAREQALASYTRRNSLYFAVALALGRTMGEEWQQITHQWRESLAVHTSGCGSSGGCIQCGSVFSSQVP